MIRWLLGLAAAGLCGLTAGTAAAQISEPVPQSALVEPLRDVVWSQPPGATLADTYPAEARTLEVSGGATLRCVADAEGLLSQCEVAWEMPGGWGFGEAVMKASRRFRAGHTTGSGQPVAGRPVWFGLYYSQAEPTLLCSGGSLVWEGGEGDAAAHAAVVRETVRERPLQFTEAGARAALARTVATLAPLRGQRPQLLERLRATCAEYAAPKTTSVPFPPLSLRAYPDGTMRLRTPSRRVGSPPAALVSNFYPERALRNEMEGRATAQCRLSLEGLLKDCVLTDETPAEYGFGQALLHLAGSFRYTPAREEGQPVEDVVLQSMRFALP